MTHFPWGLPTTETLNPMLPLEPKNIPQAWCFLEPEWERATDYRKPSHHVPGMGYQEWDPMGPSRSKSGADPPEICLFEKGPISNQAGAAPPVHSPWAPICFSSLFLWLYGVPHTTGWRRNKKSESVYKCADLTGTCWFRDRFERQWWFKNSSRWVEFSVV